MSSIFSNSGAAQRGSRVAKRRATPSVLQMELTECGAACLAMILAYYGRWMPLEELRVRCGVSRDGVRASKIIESAKDLGVVARGVRAGTRRLSELRFPMIIHWDDNHFVVLEGFRGDRVYINDPREGQRTINWDEFDESFSGTCLLFEPGSNFRQGGRPIGAMSGLFSRLGHARTPLFFVVLATLILIVPGLTAPTLTKVFVDEVLIPRTGSLMTPLLIGLGIVACTQAALVWLQQLCLARMEIKISIVATTRFFFHLFNLPMTFFFQRHAGDIANRVISNDRVARMISGELATSTVSMFSIVIYGGVMLSYDPLITLAVFGMTLANFAALRAVQRTREDGARRLLKEQALVASTSVNGLSMIETLKADGSEGRFFSRWAGMHVKAVNSQQELGVITNLLNLVPPLTSSLTTIVVLGFGGYRMLEGALTVGGLVAFQALARNFMSPVAQLVRFSANLQTIKSDIARLDDVLNHSTDQSEPQGPIPDIPAIGRGLKFENLTFGYNLKEPPLIKGLNLEIAPGRRVALVGGSGSGKSTIGKLACGMFVPWSGSVQIGGRDTRELSADRLSCLISYVNQDIVLFDGTVRENVTMWNPNIEEQTVTRALQDAALLDTIMSRPNKYDSPVGENGLNFSGGQRQLLELARAIAIDPDILVLDEATAALDPLTETLVDDNLRKRGITSLIIAHRLSTVRDADEIIVIDHGSVVEQGNHQELISLNGAYAALIAAE